MLGNRAWQVGAENNELVGIRVGIDTGGTFTDLVAMDERTGEVEVIKRESTPSAPSEAIFDCLEHLRGTPKDIAYLVLGTTVAINALHERTGARTVPSAAAYRRPRPAARSVQP